MAAKAKETGNIDFYNALPPLFLLSGSMPAVGI